MGGYYTKDGKITKNNIFIRSNLPNKLEVHEKNYLLKNGINTIIDLREGSEILEKSNCFINDKRFKCFNIPLKGHACPKREKDIPNGYIDIIDDKENIFRVFKILLESKSGVIFHCNSGKDRTGIISMLLLLIAGVNEDDIIVDYQVSYIYLRNKLRELHRKNPKLPKFLGTSKFEYMEDTLRLFYEKYGSIENYMYYLGFHDDDIESFKIKFLTKGDI